MEHLRSKEPVCRMHGFQPMYFQKITNPASALSYLASVTLNKGIVLDEIARRVRDHKLSLWVMRKGERTFTLGVTEYGHDSPIGLRVIGECYKLTKYKGATKAKKRPTKKQREATREKYMRASDKAVRDRLAAEKKAKKRKDYKPATVLRRKAD